MNSKAGKRIMNMIYGLGAAVVIVGAWGKILHLSWADLAITVGLLTEAGIFTISAFEPPHEDVNWSLVYPELAHGAAPAVAKDKKVSGKSATQQLDEMLEKSKVGPELIDSLGKNLGALSTNVKSMGDITAASVATNEYASNVKNAASSIGQMTTAALEATKSVNAMTMSTADSTAYQTQVQTLVKNLNSLNAIYSTELQDSNNHLKVMNKFYGSISKSLESLVEASADATRYKEEMAKLTRNLTALNSVYSNVLNAMAAPTAKA